MAIQPQYHWQFTERQGTTINTVNGVQSTLFKAALKGHGQISYAVQLESKDSHINLGPEVGQFGTNDFTVAFGMRVIHRHGDPELDIIGSQAMKGHGNFFSVRLSDGRIFFHVDENSKAKHYVRVQTSRLSMVSNNIWFHVAVVRKGPVIKIYIDGALAAEAESKTGVANINNTVDVKLGHSRRGTPKAQYEDLRIYHTALSPSEIEALLPPINRPLRSGEIELVATNKASIILNQDIEDLSRYAEQFQKLRLGPDTGATLYKASHFEDVSQKLYANLPDLQQTKLGTFPRSVHIWSSVGEPFTGQWIIKAPNGQYLSRRGTSLVTAPHHLLNELFVFHYNINHDQAQLIPASAQANLQLKVENEAAVLLIDDSESDPDAFSIVNPSHEQWLALNPAGTLTWTQVREDRAVFFRAAKYAENESQVGELAPGEVALYEHRAYHGKTWILSNHHTDRLDRFTHFTDFQGLNDQTSSIRLGPDTGVTLFRNFDFHATDANREAEIEDIVENVPDLKESQVGDDAISSIKIFQTIAPEDAFTSYTTRLSQDYRMVDNKLKEFSAYRTTLRFEPGAGEIEVSATDLTTIEVEGQTYEVDETRSVTLKPNELNFIMMTSEADGLNTPGLKIRTRNMAKNEQVLLFPNQEAHQQIAQLEDDALWNATDAQGNLIVDQKAHSQEEVARVQNTVKRMMATVAYTETPSDVRNRPVTDHHSRLVQPSTRSVSGTTIENHPWELKLGKVNDRHQVRRLKSGAALVQANSLTSPANNAGIEEEVLSQEKFTQLLSQATSREEVVPVAGKGFGTTNVVSSRSVFGSIGKGLKNAVKKAKSIVIGAVKGVVHVLVKTVEGVIDFIVDTVEKVAEFIEAVVETVVKGIKKFIEFLQFLFNWDDILETQRYLVDTINAGFDYAVHLAQASKKPVSAFIDNLQDTVEDSINTLVTSLGGEPSPVRTSKFELPEVAEWFFSKLLGGSKQKGANLTPNLGTNISGDSPLAEFTSSLFEALEDVIGLFLRTIEGLGETVASLLANPRQPQLALIILLEALRDVVIQFLEVIEKFALGFLDVIGEAIAQVQNLLNAEINIPFISSLFKLIGAGPLTTLNVGTLLLAIPVTVVYKLVFNEKPQLEALSADFTSPVSINAPAEIAQTPLNTRSVVQPSAQSVSPREGSIRFWGTVSIFTDLLNGLISAGLDSVPEGADNGAPTGLLETISIVLSGCSWLGSFPSSPGFPGGRPYNFLAHKATITDNEQEVWERRMWGWRTFVLGLDIVVIIATTFFPETLSNISNISFFKISQIERMRRLNPGSIWISVLFSLVDIGLTSKYLSTIPKDDNPGIEITNEVVAWLPSFLAFLRLFGLKSSYALAGIDVIATGVSTILSSVMLADDIASLKEAG